MFEELMDLFDRKKRTSGRGGIRGTIGRAIAGEDDSRRHADEHRHRRDDDDKRRDHDWDDDDRDDSRRDGHAKRAFDFD